MRGPDIRDGDNASAVPVTVRRLRADEWARFRAIRLAALADTPSAFGATLAEAQAQPDSFWQQRCASSATSAESIAFIAERGDDWLGLVGGAGPPVFPRGAYLVMMWVDPAARGTGVADRLVDAVIQWSAARGDTELRLNVETSNRVARRLYERHGFRDTGERGPHRHMADLEEMEMARALGILTP